MPRSGLSCHANWLAPNGAILIFALFYYKAAAPNGAFPQSIPVKKMCPNGSRRGRLGVDASLTPALSEREGGVAHISGAQWRDGQAQ